MKTALKVALPLLVLVGGVMGAVAIIKSRPTPARTAVEHPPTPVEVLEVAPSGERVDVRAMGTVIPARQVVVQPEVSGRIVELAPSLVPGGRVEAGDVLVRIDPRDYELAVEQQKAGVAQAAFNLRLEQGRQNVAEREWELLESDVATTKEGRQLALRKPHIENARAALASARSALQRARLNVERTTIEAPFNALVVEESAEQGQLVSPQARLATLVGTDRYWVEVSVPIERLPWVRVPSPGSDEPGSRATVTLDAGRGQTITREGRVVRLLGDLDPAGRMARLVVAVDRPLDPPTDAAEEEGASTAGLPLLLGSYVNVVLEGTQLLDVYRVPRLALREGDVVWVATDDGALEIRDVDVVWRREDDVLVRSGLRPGDKLILSRLPTAVDGMRVRVVGGEPAARAPVSATPASAGSPEVDG